MLEDMPYVINMYCKTYFCTNNLWLLVCTVYSFVSYELWTRELESPKTPLTNIQPSKKMRVDLHAFINQFFNLCISSKRNFSTSEMSPFCCCSFHFCK